MTRSKDLVLQELARENSRLTEIERTRDEARTRIELLHSELAAASIAAPISLSPPFVTEGKTPSTPTDKVKLFRSLFRGREVSANVARRMGCYLVTETMNRRHELSMESYDRLIPNQDTMPRGGFGNLIALPLQYEPRQQGNSVFIDERFEPYTDQWTFLASVQRIEPVTVEMIAREATRAGQVVGVRFAEAIDDEEAVAPWSRLPSGYIPTKRINGPFPSRAKAVLAQRLFIEKEDYLLPC